MSTYAPPLPAPPLAPKRGHGWLIGTSIAVAVLLVAAVIGIAIGVNDGSKAPAGKASRIEASGGAKSVDMTAATGFIAKATNHLNHGSALLDAGRVVASTDQLDLAADDIDTAASLVSGLPRVANPLTKAADHLRTAADDVRAGRYSAAYDQILAGVDHMRSAQAAVP